VALLVASLLLAMQHPSPSGLPALLSAFPAFPSRGQRRRRSDGPGIPTHPVTFELTEATRQAIDDDVRANRKSGSYLSTGRRKPDGRLTTRQYAACCRSGLRALAWTLTNLAPTRCVGPRRP
jgi:hypothetical protein